MHKILNLTNTRGWKSYQPLDGPTQREFRWLLDVAVHLSFTHVCVPTELDGVDIPTLLWIQREATQRSMQLIIWTDKKYALPWMLNDGINALATLADRFYESIFDIGREIDTLWLLHNNNQQVIMDNLYLLKLTLINFGIPPEHIMFGGTVIESALELDAVGPGILTYTNYHTVDRAYFIYGNDWPNRLAEVAGQEAAFLRGAMSPYHELIAIEIGWHNLQQHQLTVHREIMKGVKPFVHGYGLWSLINFVNCQDAFGRCTPAEMDFGILDNNGQPREAFKLWYV